MRRGTLWVVIGTLFITALATSFVWYKIDEKRLSEANAQIEILNNTVDSLGPTATAYTINVAKVDANTEIKEEDLLAIQLPVSMVGDSYVTNISDLVGKFYKVGIQKGTPITEDVVMVKQIDDTTREHDISVDHWTVGLKTGDAVDLRLTLPRGEDYIVLSKVIIKEVNELTLKVDLTETEWQTYQGALVDYYLYLSKGSSIYVDKYVEPGVQNKAIAYYSVPENVRAIMLVNPNIVVTAQEVINDNLRSTIKAALAATITEEDNNESEISALQSGRQAFTDNVLKDTTTRTQTDAEAEENGETTTNTTDTSSNKSTSATLETQIEDVTEQTEDIVNGGLE